MLNEHAVVLFSEADISGQVPDYDTHTNFRQVVENLVNKGLLLQVERGKYCRATFYDEHVIGTYVVQGGAIAYWTALNLHGLTEQLSNTIFVQSTHQKVAKVILDQHYTFVKVKAHKVMGVSHMGYGLYRFPITDVEKTIIDCFDLPQHSPGMDAVIRAFMHAPLQADKLIQYTQALGNIAVIKRMGFLAQHFNIEGLAPFVDYALSQVNSRYDLLDPTMLPKGTHDAQWRLRVNLGLEGWVT